MTMAKYVNGPRWAVQHVPGSAINAGDVIVQGNLTFIADVDDPVGIGLPIVQTALYIGGLYQVAADAAYINGTYVYWNPSTQQVTSVADVLANVPFGWIAAGPAGLVSDGGPTGAGSLCFVLHDPDRLLEASNGLTIFGGALYNAVLGQFRTEGNVYANAGAPLGANAADTTDDILFGVQLPANVFDVAGRQLNVIAQGTTGATVNNKRFKIFLNPTMTGQTVNPNGTITGGHVTAGTPISDSGTWVNGTTPNSAAGWEAQATITKYGATGSNTQKGQGTAILGTLHGGIQPGQSLTLPENAVINVVVTGASYTTGAAGDVNLEQFTVTGSN